MGTFVCVGFLVGWPNWKPNHANVENLSTTIYLIPVKHGDFDLNRELEKENGLGQVLQGEKYEELVCIYLFTE